MHGEFVSGELKLRASSDQENKKRMDRGSWRLAIEPNNPNWCTIIIWWLVP